MSVTLHPQTQLAAFSPNVVDEFDCETAALIRAVLCPLFDTATSWKALSDGLGARGYGLAIRDGRLVVHAHRTVFALSVDTPMGEPEVVADGVFEASVVDGDVVTSTSSW